ncbi:MAG: hypothetical protein KBC84_01240 [Proteobacteria bacterium]|nr:hypothetical protein [Pseudomonadota bacterium]
METKPKQCCSGQTQSATSEKREANTWVALGAGVGALGIGAALVTGAVCPICFIVAPGVIGAGVLKHWNIRKQEKKKGSNE